MGPSPIKRKLKARARFSQFLHRFDELAQTFFGHEPSDIDDELGVRGDSVGLPCGCAILQPEDRRIATVGDHAHARGVGAVVAHGEAAEIGADHEQPVGAAHDGLGQAPADRVAHADVRAARAGDERHVERACDALRSPSIGIQPVRQDHVGRECRRGAADRARR